MQEKIIDMKEVVLSDKKYCIYLKEVPTQIAPSGEVLRTTVRAFVKKK